MNMNSKFLMPAGAMLLAAQFAMLPAIAGDALLLRTVDHLYCIKQPGDRK